MNCNITPVTTEVKKLEAATNRLSPALASDWNDEVKESYRKYISQCKDNMSRIQTAVAKFRSECDNLSRLDVDSLIASADSLCSAIEGA